MEKDFKIIVPKKKELYFFFGIIFGEILLKKDFKIIVPKNKNLFGFKQQDRCTVVVAFAGGDKVVFLAKLTISFWLPL